MSVETIGKLLRFVGFLLIIPAAFLGGDGLKSPDASTGQTWPTFVLSRADPTHVYYVTPAIWIAWLLSLLGAIIFVFWGDKIVLLFVKQSAD